MPSGSPVDAVEGLLHAGDFAQAYQDLHQVLCDLPASGMDEAVPHCLVIAGDAAWNLRRPDVAALNWRDAADLYQARGLADDGGRLAERIGVAEEGMRAPFESLGDEREWYLDVLRACIRRGVRRSVLEGSLHPERQFEYDVGLQEIGAFVEGAAPPDAELFRLDRELAALRAWTARRQAVTELKGSVAALLRRLGLGGLEGMLLVAAMGPALSPEVLRAYMRLWGDYLKRAPDVAFLARLVSLGDPEEERARLALAEGAPLCRTGLVVVTPPPPETPAPRIYHSVTVPDSLATRVRGHAPISSRHQGVAVDPPLPCAHPESAKVLAARLAAGAPVTALYGPRGLGKRTLVAQVAAEMGLEQVAVDLASVGDHWMQEVNAGRTDALLLDAVLILDGTRLGEGGPPDGLLAWLERSAQHERIPVVLALKELPKSVEEDLDARSLIRLKVPPAEAQADVWRHHLIVAGEDMTPHDDAVRETVARYPLAPGAIRRAAVAATSRDGEALGIDALVWAAQLQTQTGLAGIAERVVTSFSWDDLVLPEETLDSLDSVLIHYRYRAQVMGEWGFERMLPYGKALSVLFSGPPGTGKTMAASIVARELDLPMYRVNLASIVSKYIGETEKNLEQVFSEAQLAHVVLVFDEADSLFSRRTQVRDSVDRYANLEVNFLLQKMESFDGVVVLTTNFESSLDEAFKRRIRYKVHFPFPEASVRTELWAAMIPSEADVKGDLDFDALGEDFELSGGHIKNAVVRAAFMAAVAEGPIDMEHLVASANREYKEMGKLVLEERDA